MLHFCNAINFFNPCYSMGLTLHQHSHSHGGLGSHSHEASGHSSANINVRAAYIHVLGDIIQSLGVLIAAVIVYFRVSNLRSSINIVEYIISTCRPARSFDNKNIIIILYYNARK